jgi:hypothetical protein
VAAEIIGWRCTNTRGMVVAIEVALPAHGSLALVTAFRCEIDAVVVVHLPFSSGAKLTWKSRSKSLPNEDTHLNCQPIHRRKRSI